MSVNFFSWIRDGVRQSVLLGVSDAIEHLGTPAAESDLHPSVVAFMKGSSSSGEVSRLPSNPTHKNAGQRKRLGRSLKELDNNGVQAAQ